jgi:hypothetical protein
MTPQIEARHQAAWSLLFAAWAIALLSTFGALFIGEVMGKNRACCAGISAHSCSRLQ